MLRAGAILLAALAAFHAGPALADTASDCLQDEDSRLKLGACSDFIANQPADAAQLSRAYAERGRANVALASLDAALADYNQAVRLDPESGWALYLRGYLNRQRGKFADSVRDFAAAQVIARKGSRAKSAETTKQFVAELGDEIALSQLGECRGGSDKSSMLAACNDYLAGGSGDKSSRAVAFFNRGFLKLDKDDDAGALADYDASLKLDPSSVDVLFYRGLLLTYLDHNGEALADFEKCLSIVESWPAAQNEQERDYVGRLVADLRGRANQARAADVLDRHWIAYLQEIQSKGTYPNWSGPPFDLYSKAMAR